jgi:uncharacterized membrane protein YidH (DUF202 family)
VLDHEDDMNRTENSRIELPKADAGAVHKNESVSISRIQLILAEKRTTLAVMRTGIGVFTLPLSVVTVLVATSRYYDVLETYHFLVPLLGICAGLIVLGVYLVHRSVRRIRKQDALINRIKQQDPGLVGFYRDQLDAEGPGSGTR